MMRRKVEERMEGLQGEVVWSSDGGGRLWALSLRLRRETNADRELVLQRYLQL